MKRFALLTLLVLGALSVTAQELIFFDGEVRVYERLDGQLFELQDSEDGVLTFGFVLDRNYVVRTFDGFAEITLPHGHLLKLDSNTEVVIENALSQSATAGEDRVSVNRGRLRSIVADLTGTSRSFSVRTPTAVGGVRGTDFLTEVSEQGELIAVKEGLVEFTTDAGTTVALAANQYANALAAQFAAVQSSDVVAQFYGSLNELSEQAQTLEAVQIAQATPEDEPAAESDEPAETEPSDGADDPVRTDTPAVSTADDPGTPAGVARRDEDGPFDQFMIGLTEALGLEIGTLSVAGTTYSKLVAQPTFEVGELRAGLYLPMIYSGNMFDSDDWYKPAGNNEWSFGTDYSWTTDTLAAVGDFFGDLALKIKFIEWGDQRDDFFFKVGNINTFQLGHGLLMRDYANDSDFPSIRRIGLNVGFDFGRAGFEALTNDLAEPEVFGLRLYGRPFGGFPLAFGVSGVTDLAPASDLPETDAQGNVVFADTRTTNPLFLNVALDIDLPIVETDPLSVIAYTDVGGLLPYLREGVAGLDPGFQTQALTEAVDGSTRLRNYGVVGGIMGNVTMLDYRAELQFFNGIFEPAFYDADYDRTRGEVARQTIAYLQDPNDPEYDYMTLGVYGEASATLFDLVTLTAGYRWPWTIDGETDKIAMGDQDYLLAELRLQEGLLPLDISAGVSYERTFFVPTLLDETGFEGATLFDENTVLSGEIVYPVAPIIDIVASVSTTVLRNDDGTIIYEQRNGQLKPKIGPVISIETRLGGAAQ
ncbi:MAG: FecR domain-containing protein [Spirochaetales bacterium]